MSSQLKVNMSVEMTLTEFEAYKTGSEALLPNTIIRVTDTKETFFADGTIGGLSDSLSGGNIGVISMFAGNVAQAGSRFCNFDEVSRVDFAPLFAIIGETYGAGDGLTTFNLPNLKGRMIIGLDHSDSDFDTVGKTGGEKTHQLTISEMPNHHHNYSKSGSETVQNSSNLGADETAGSDATSETATSTNGSDQPHNNMQPYVVMNYIIKY